MKREKMLTIRVTDEEHARLLERCEGKRLAEWMRRGCLGEPVARTGKLPTLAPPLLRHLAAIGNRFDQIRIDPTAFYDMLPAEFLFLLFH